VVAALQPAKKAKRFVELEEAEEEVVVEEEEEEEGTEEGMSRL